jgi:hypothetical protein
VSGTDASHSPGLLIPSTHIQRHQTPRARGWESQELEVSEPRTLSRQKEERRRAESKHLLGANKDHQKDARPGAQEVLR